MKGAISDPSSISLKISSEYEYFGQKIRVSTSIFSSILEYLDEYLGMFFFPPHLVYSGVF